MSNTGYQETGTWWRQLSSVPNLLQVQGTSNKIAHGSYHHLESNVEATHLAEAMPKYLTTIGKQQQHPWCTSRGEHWVLTLPPTRNFDISCWDTSLPKIPDPYVPYPVILSIQHLSPRHFPIGKLLTRYLCWQQSHPTEFQVANNKQQFWRWSSDYLQVLQQQQSW